MGPVTNSSSNSKTALLYLRHYIAPGATMPLPSSRCVFWPRPMNMLQICCLFCQFVLVLSCIFLIECSADLEITVPMLVQIDKLVQLIESPVFTCETSYPFQTQAHNSPSHLDIRLQLLEPERYPYLFKCLYGILMLLPQSSAFVSLRNRLNAVNSAGFLQIAPKS
jgi:hypothetical protein